MIPETRRSTMREALGSGDLVRNLVLRELRSTYSGSVLGFVWVAAEPALTMAIFVVVFGMILRVPIPGAEGTKASFPAFVLTGLLPWNVISVALTAGCASLVANGNLLRKVYFCR